MRTSTRNPRRLGAVRVTLIAALLCAACSDGGPSEAAPDDAPGTSGSASAWRAGVYTVEGDDWIQLASGTWRTAADGSVASLESTDIMGHLASVFVDVDGGFTHLSNAADEESVVVAHEESVNDTLPPGIDALLVSDPAAAPTTWRRSIGKQWYDVERRAVGGVVTRAGSAFSSIEVWRAEGTEEPRRIALTLVMNSGDGPVQITTILDRGDAPAPAHIARPVAVVGAPLEALLARTSSAESATVSITRGRGRSLASRRAIGSPKLTSYQDCGHDYYIDRYTGRTYCPDDEPRRVPNDVTNDDAADRLEQLERQLEEEGEQRRATDRRLAEIEREIAAERQREMDEAERKEAAARRAAAEDEARRAREAEARAREALEREARKRQQGEEYFAPEDRCILAFLGGVVVLGAAAALAPVTAGFSSCGSPGDSRGCWLGDGHGI